MRWCGRCWESLEFHNTKAFAVAEQYVKDNRERETTIAIVQLLAEYGLTVAAVFSGSWLLAAAGTAFGLVAAAGEFGRANKLNNVARSQLGGDPLIDDPEAANFNYLMGLANLVLAGVDAVLLLPDGITTLRGLPAARRVMNTGEGAEAFSRLSPEKIAELQRAIRGEGGPGALPRLQGELGEDFEPASSALRRVSGGGEVSAPSLDRSLFQNVAEAEIPRYEALIIGDRAKGERLLREFGTFGNFESFQRVFNAIERTDLDRMAVVFSDTYQNSLTPPMQKRYSNLLRDCATGELVKQGGASFQDRLEIIEQVHNLRTNMREALSGMEPEQQEWLNLGQRNFAYGSFDITLPNHNNISDDFVSVSGKGVSTAIVRNGVGNSFEGRAIIPDIPRARPERRLAHTRGANAHDSERKLFEDILKKMEEQLGSRLNPLQNYQGRGFSGQVNLYSEMSPCESCTEIIEQQFRAMFGNDIDINIRYGVDFEDE